VQYSVSSSTPGIFLWQLVYFQWVSTEWGDWQVFHSSSLRTVPRHFHTTPCANMKHCQQMSSEQHPGITAAQGCADTAWLVRDAGKNTSLVNAKQIHHFNRSLLSLKSNLRLIHCQQDPTYNKNQQPQKDGKKWREIKDCQMRTRSRLRVQPTHMVQSGERIALARL